MSAGTDATEAPTGDDGRSAPEDGDSPADGRAARAARTRQAIVDGLLSLLEEGDLRPSANRIAERAGISLRLIYHHFGDLESLFRATSIRQAERMASMVEPIDPALGTHDRIEAFARQRGRMLEWITPVRRAALLHEPFSDELRCAREAFMRAGDAQVAALFAGELAALPEPERSEVLSAACMACSWNAWDSLRSTGLDPDAATAVVRRALMALLDR